MFLPRCAIHALSTRDVNFNKIINSLGKWPEEWCDQDQVIIYQGNRSLQQVYMMNSRLCKAG